MAEENGDKNKTGVLDKVKEDAAALRKTLEEKAKQQVEELKQPEKTQLYRSMFRVKHDDEPRNRALSVLSNVFFHLHPAKVNRDATKYNFTWGMGGITFYRDGSHGSTLADPVIGAIARAHGKSPAQVMLRWGLQEGGRSFRSPQADPHR